MARGRRRPILALVVPLALVAIACGSSDGTPAASTGSSATGGAAAASGAPAASGAASVPGGSPGTGGSTAGTSAAPGASGSAAPGASPPAGTGAASQAGSWEEIPAIVADVEPSVVTIQRQGAEGSGVIWSDDGVIVTNNHVVEGATSAVVVFADGTRATARVVAGDPLSDVAIVRTDRTGLEPAEWAAAVPPVGSLAIAMGNPLGFENSVTAGIVSGVNRAVPGAAREAPALVDLVQTDAAISPGNSGGALVGADRRVIGLNVAYIPPQAGSVSIGFAIPAPTVVDVVGQLLDDGTAEHSWLGVQPVQLTPQIARQFGINAEEGALVIDVVDGGPAAQAGIRPGDVIVAIDGQPVRTVEDLLTALRKLDVGQRTTLRILRAGQERNVEVTLGAFPSRS